MNNPDHELLEQELLQLRPARPPEDFTARLQAARPLIVISRSTAQIPHPTGAPHWLQVFRWLAPAAAAIALAIIVIRQPVDSTDGKAGLTRARAAAIHADDVQIDRQLLSAYDAVAELPGGEPVRFRCREWMDEVTLRDTARGVTLQKRLPRFEVVPVRLETY